MSYLRDHDLTILIVTYDDRRKFLKKSIEELNKQKKYISNLIIVQNGIEYDMNLFMQEITNKISTKFVINKENSGSAGGFGIGVKEALHTSGSKILILDDDNYVSAESFKKIIQMDNKFLTDSYGEKIALSLFRPQHDQDEKKFQRNYDFSYNFYKNTISQFSFIHKFQKAKMRKVRLDESISELVIAPYSGLLVEKRLISELEPIKQEYYVYGDDTRFTARMTQSGIRILQRQDLTAIDLEDSWYQNDKSKINKKNDVKLFLEMKDKTKLWRPYYRLRNAVNVSKEVFRTNNFLFVINLILYVVVPFFIYMPKNKMGFKNYKLFLRAVYSGIRGDLGRINEKEFTEEIQ